jgi:VCBS repeat-containing protein
MPTVSSTSTPSFSNTPQAKDDAYAYKENGGIYYLNVLSNDLGGAAKSLYSIGSGSSTTALQTAYNASVTYTSAKGARIAIENSGANAGTISYDGGALYESLAQGDTATDTFTYAIRLGNGTLSWAATTITVTGANDAPVVSSTVMGSATEDGVAVMLNALAKASDVDAGTVLAVKNVPVVLPPGVTFDAAANTFTLNAGNAAYQSLAANSSTTVTVDYMVTDGIASVPASVSWTVTGTNDAPVVSAAAVGNATEDVAADALQALANATDVDQGTTLTVTYDQADLPAGVTFDAPTNTFKLDSSHAAYQSLAAGKTTTVTVNYGVSDGTVTTATSASWTVTGTNDAPVLASNSITLGTVQEDVKLIATGKVTAIDPDQGATQTWSIEGSGDGRYGSIAIDNSGNWTYTLNNAAHQDLAQAETHDETFTVQVIDDQGATANQIITVNVSGSNDAPAAEADKTISVPAGGTATLLNITTPKDIDGDNLTVTFTALPTNGIVKDALNQVITSGTQLSVAQLNGLKFTPTGSAGTSSQLSYVVSDSHGATDNVNISTVITNNGVTVTELITNGGFETGNLTGWTAVGSSGSFYVDTSSPSPVSNHVIPGPAAGSYFAVSDQNGPTVAAIEQSFNVPTGAGTVTLSFDMFVTNWHGSTVAGSALNTTTSGQYARVDLLSAGSPQLDLATVLRNFYSGADNVNGTPTAAWKHYSFDITSIVSQGGTFDLRFAQKDTLFFMNQGVDNVSVKIGSPGSGALTLSGTNGNDVIVGGAGADMITGGGGDDLLAGGAGRDTFIYNTVNDFGSSGDVITDFVKGAGADVINLQGLLTSAGAPRDSGAFSNGWVKFTSVGGNTLVQFDSNGGGDAFVTLVTLTGTLLTSADVSNFIL